MKTLFAYLNDESGATAAEYALIIAVMGGLVVVAMTTLGTGLNNAMTAVGTCLTTPNTTNCK
jgi:pilus assembly protein Flp/PilA